ncbi:MAG: HU family DNA-binding protein [Clostridiales bacterium]|nr:HU family DNA-binding protein [Clostridiales bacterium]
MSKTEFIAAMSEKSGLSKKDAEVAYKAFTETVIEELKKGEKVSLIGFGTFEVVERGEREGLNPRTKEKIVIPAAKAPKFKASKPFKEAVNA